MLRRKTKRSSERLNKSYTASSIRCRNSARLNSLGVYGKARLQKEFSDRLIELGYDGEVTRILVETILFRNA